METVAPKITLDSLNLLKIQDPNIRAAFNVLANLIHNQLDIIAKVINMNAITYVSQDAQPTPDEGQFIIWKDADALAGNPQAYIVTKQDGAIYTFASVEVV
jgi:hypothetical protein